MKMNTFSIRRVRIDIIVSNRTENFVTLNGEKILFWFKTIYVHGMVLSLTREVPLCATTAKKNSAKFDSIYFSSEHIEFRRM